MRNSNKKLIASVAVVAATIAAALTGMQATSGIDGGGRTRGSITRFGSIFVNDVEYFLDASQIRINGEPAIEAQLRVGQVVTVDGFVNADLVSGTATTVDFDSDLRGRITAIDPVNTSLQVLGQTVRVNGGTSFDEFLSPANLGGLSAGQIVEISGYRNVAGDIVAARIDRSSSSSDRITGTISSLDAVNRTFRISGLTVDYSTAGRVDGVIADGALIEVEGARAGGATLLATTLEVRAAGLGGAFNSGASLEGIVNSPLSAGRFAVNGQTVSISSATQFIDGTVADLLPDAKVEAEGRIDASGSIAAETIEFRYDDAARVEGLVSSVDVARGTFRALGLTLKTHAGTRYEDKSAARVRNFRLADLRVGDTVDVTGAALRDPRTVRVERVVRQKPDGRTRLHARVTDLRVDQFRLLGVPVYLLPSTVVEEADGSVISRAQFQSRAANRDVHVRGRFDGVSLAAAEVTLEQ